jgi:Response regulator containing a CheY-like receiver domain and an HTH DNA-binding domain
MTNIIRVLAVENDEDFIYLIRAAIDDQPDMELTGCAAAKEDAIHMAVQQQPDIVLMDLNLSESNLDGIETAKEIRLSTNAKIIILTAFENPQTVIEASKKSFASGYIFKSQFEFLVDTIRKTAQGHTPQEQMIRSLILNDLTAAELGVLQSMFAQDRRLLSSQKTIANQKTTILRKLGLKNKRDLEKIFCGSLGSI